MRNALPILLVLAACKAGSEAKTKADPQDNIVVPEDKPVDKPVEPTAAARFAKLEVAFDGKPVAIEHAFIKRLAPDRFQLYLTNEGGSCSELLDNLFNGSESKIDVLADLTPRLGADGTQVLEVSEIYEGGATIKIEPGQKVVVGGTADKGTPTEVSLDFDAAGDGVKMAVHGSFVAEGCGLDDPGADGMPKEKHPSTGTIKIAGKTIPVLNAIVKGDDLMLSSGPKDCSGTTPWAEVILERRDKMWSVSGTWLEEPIAVTQFPDEGTRALEVVPGTKGTSGDGPTVALALAGAGKIGDYTIELDGTVQALACPK
jgi:hypothetical protein